MTQDTISWGCLSQGDTPLIQYPKYQQDIHSGRELNFRTRLSLSIYLFFNNKRRYFAMQVATLPHKLVAVL